MDAFSTIMSLIPQITNLKDIKDVKKLLEKQQERRIRIIHGISVSLFLLSQDEFSKDSLCIS